MKKFDGQYNDAYTEIDLEFKVKINLVVPNNRVKTVTAEQVEKWFRRDIAVLEAGRQLYAGNEMQTIEVEKL